MKLQGPVRLGVQVPVRVRVRLGGSAWLSVCFFCAERAVCRPAHMRGCRCYIYESVFNAPGQVSAVFDYSQTPVLTGYGKVVVRGMVWEGLRGASSLLLLGRVVVWALHFPTCRGASRSHVMLRAAAVTGGVSWASASLDELSAERDLNAPAVSRYACGPMVEPWDCIRT